MGISFIGNPFDQDGEHDDSDWEMNAVEEWILPPQEIAFVDEVGRGTIDLILAPDDDESSAEEDIDANWLESNENDETDADYIPEEDEHYDFDYFYDSHEDDDYDDDDIDYVTYPLPDENPTESERAARAATADSNPNAGETSDTD